MATHTQRKFSSSQRRVSAIIHVTGLLSFAASLLWLPNITNPLHNGFGGSYQFLTIIALTMSTITFGIGLLADVSLSKQLFALKNIFSVCATPLEILVSTLYWSLRAIDKKAVVPPGHELPFIPDLGFHAMPAIMLTLDAILASPPWLINVFGAMTLNAALAFIYWGWIEYCFSRNGWYPYPLFELLSTWKKIFLLVISATLMTSNTMILKWVHGRINGVKEVRRGPFDSIKRD